MISAIVSQCLTRSIDKHHEFSFDNMQEMIQSIINHHNVGYTPDEIMKDLDEQIKKKAQFLNITSTNTKQTKAKPIDQQSQEEAEQAEMTEKIQHCVYGSALALN